MRDSVGKRQDELRREQSMRVNLHHFLECIREGKTDMEIAQEFDVHLETVQRMRRDADLSSFEPYVTIGKRKFY